MDARSTWLAYQVAADVFRKVATRLAARGVDVLPVKGILTARTLYDDVSERPLRDIDVRVRRRDFRRAVRAAREWGWHKKHVVLLGQVLWEVEGIEVDVKSALAPPGLCAASIDDVFDRARRAVEPFGFPHLEPEWTDHALMLVLNAFKDGLAGMPWALEDLRRVARHPSFDAATLVERARAGGVASAAWIVADWLVESQGAAEWRAVRNRIGARSERVLRVYAAWRALGAPLRLGHFVVPTLGDEAWRVPQAFAQSTAGLARGFALRAAGRLRARR